MTVYSLQTPQLCTQTTGQLGLSPTRIRDPKTFSTSEPSEVHQSMVLWQPESNPRPSDHESSALSVTPLRALTTTQNCLENVFEWNRNAIFVFEWFAIKITIWITATKTRFNAPLTRRGKTCLRQSNDSTTNYHMFLRLWSEISLFHKLIYDIAPGSILIGWNVAVRLWHHR